MSTIRYETDIVAWAHEQAALIRAGQLEHLDLVNLAEEIEEVSKSEQRELMSRMIVLLAHLLKWHFQPEYPNKKSWNATIRTQRESIEEHLEDAPSLRSKLADEKWLHKVYRDARLSASNETGIDFDDFPESLPWSIEQVLMKGWYPTAQ